MVTVKAFDGAVGEIVDAAYELRAGRD